MNCPRCNQGLATDAKFCNQCGFSISAEMKAATLAVASDATKSSSDLAETVIATTAPTGATQGRVIEAKYELLELLGEGGMGSVYRARRLRIGDYVAIKILHQKYVTEDSALERFRREAQAAAVLHHPNVVGIYDYGEEPDKGIPAFIVMELVSGTPLRDILDREKRLSYTRAIALIQTACAGVGAAHRRHIVHRDIKPDNFIVIPPESEGDSEVVKVVDFGIAKLRDIAGANNLTQTGIVMGTPYYMSPEQCRGESLDSRSDVYSLGATLYEMIAGNPPFTAASVTGVVAKHLTEQPPPFPANLGIPPAVEAVIRRALAKDPNARQADAVAFARELQTSLSAAATNPILAPKTMPNAWEGSTNQTAPYSPPNSQSNPQAYSQPNPQSYSQPNPQLYSQPTQPNAPVVTQNQPHWQAQQPLIAQKKPFKGMLFINIVAAAIVVTAIGGGVWYALKPNSQSDAAASSPNPSTGSANTGSVSSVTANQNSATAVNPPVSANKNTRNEAQQMPPGNTNSSAHPGGNANTSTPDSAPVGGDAERVEQKILAGQPVSAADLTGLPKLRLRLLRNTVYARHGRIFDSPELRVYFARQSWYQPRPDYKDTLLTATDKTNVETILALENRSR